MVDTIPMLTVTHFRDASYCMIQSLFDIPGIFRMFLDISIEEALHGLRRSLLFYAQQNLTFYLS